MESAPHAAMCRAPGMAARSNAANPGPNRPASHGLQEMAVPDTIRTLMGSPVTAFAVQLVLAGKGVQ
jgi:hypothetical protein